MARDAVIIRGSVRGARRKGHELRRTGRAIQGIILREFSGGVAPSTLRSVRAFAPHRTGRLERGMQARIRSYGGRITIEIISTARNPMTGFDYLPITRHGHRVPFIEASPGKALRIPLAEGVIYRKRVRGYKPKRDWVEDAYLEAQRELDDAAERIGRTIDRRLL